MPSMAKGKGVGGVSFQVLPSRESNAARYSQKRAAKIVKRLFTTFVAARAVLSKITVG